MIGTKLTTFVSTRVLTQRIQQQIIIIFIQTIICQGFPSMECELSEKPAVDRADERGLTPEQYVHHIDGDDDWEV